MLNRPSTIHGWGRYPVISAATTTFETARQAKQAIMHRKPWIAQGMGKSYGDSALAPYVVQTARYDKLVRFNPASGEVTCESGITLAELIDIFLPRGWFLKVTPGTKLITVGGAIAADVHGKNHHVAGCFSDTVTQLKLMLPGGTTTTCSPDHNRDLFRATCGGMGLTGLILEATLQLRQVNGNAIRERVIRCRNLETVFEQFEAHQDLEYSVAWIDCLSRGKDMGRSVLMVGTHSRAETTLPAARPAGMPFDGPGMLLNTTTVKLFNNLYYATRPSSRQERTTTIDAFFYPLDRIAHWNRMYGKGGFTQYQCVLPKSVSLQGLQHLLTRIAASGKGSFLAVLKLFGPQNANLLSFPMEGYTLALDFKIEPGLFTLLDELDRIVIDFGGRLYLAKDVRMSADTLRAGYPQLDTFRSIRRQIGAETAIQSLQSTRLRI